MCYEHYFFKYLTCEKISYIAITWWIWAATHIVGFPANPFMLGGKVGPLNLNPRLISCLNSFLCRAWVLVHGGLGCRSWFLGSSHPAQFWFADKCAGGGYGEHLIAFAVCPESIARDGSVSSIL